MAKNEIVNKLCELILEDIPFTGDRLDVYGISTEDLIRLKAEGILAYGNNEVYSFKNAAILYGYGKDLLTYGKASKAYKCFAKCLEISPNHVGASFNLFMKSVKDRDFENSIKYLDILYQHSEEHHLSDYNYYLFLLSNIINLPDNYLKFAQGLRYDDVKLNDFAFDSTHYTFICFENKIRQLVMHRRFREALELYRELEDKGKLSLKDNIAKVLVKAAKDQQLSAKINLKKYIVNKDYAGAVRFLEELRRHRSLSLGEKYSLTLCKTLMRIRYFSFVPVPTVTLTQDLFKAIDGDNYDLALTLVRKSNIKESDNLYVMILNDIKEAMMANKTKSINSSKIEELQNEVLDKLYNRNLEELLILVEACLEFMNRESYYEIFASLAKIEMLEQDSTFDNIAWLLTNLNKVGFKAPLEFYFHNFFLALNECKFEIASLYLDVIRKFETLGKLSFDVSSLTNLLNQTIEDNNALILTDLYEGLTPEEIKFKKLCKMINESSESDTMSDKDTSLFVAKLHELISKGEIAILLDEMSKQKMELVLSEARNYTDVKAFTIGTNYPRIVLMKQNAYRSDIDYNDLKLKACKAYKDGNYDLCIESIAVVLAVSSNLNKYMARSFKLLGMAYYQKGNARKAYDYLLIADDIFKSVNMTGDLDEIIALIQEELKIEQKPMFEMSLDDFSHKLDYYGIDEIEKIAYLVCGSGVSVHEACQMFNVSNEQECLVNLILARDCYTEELYAKGDKYLKDVERFKGKTDLVKKVYDDVVRNKKFFKNRKSGGYKPLVNLPVQG